MDIFVSIISTVVSPVYVFTFHVIVHCGCLFVVCPGIVVSHAGVLLVFYYSMGMALDIPMFVRFKLTVGKVYR